MSAEIYPKAERPDYFIIIWMIFIHLLAIPALFDFTWSGFVLMMVLNFLTGCFGITLGFHRLLSHRTFKVPKWLERFFATCGTLALQGGVDEWVAHHRMHHAGSDTAKDPHNSKRGFWYSHMFWLFEVIPEFDDKKKIAKFSRDINADPYYRFISKPWVYTLMQIALAGVLYLFGGVNWVVWGIGARLVWGYHVTWFVNSATHKWGYRNYEVNDLSRNCWWVALLTWGEGWHNNHHTYGDVCRAGHKWWEIDTTYAIIKGLSWMGLATDIKELPQVEARGSTLETNAIVHTMVK